mmetsp:Transcript_100055/g.283238  ORF Transcript_100055/g.283238 Transcript_100055/m.283238 type:complete len:347 (+) Transcript_100055:58-1098(+)
MALQQEPFPPVDGADGAVVQNQLFKKQFTKTKLCKFFATYQCRHGDDCVFAHGSTDLKALPDLKKTSICRGWRHGSCTLTSAECPYAHGQRELRQTIVYAHQAKKTFMQPDESLARAHAKVNDSDSYQQKANEERIQLKSKTGTATLLNEFDSVLSARGFPLPRGRSVAEAAHGDLECHDKPSVVVWNLPRQYTKRMLMTEIGARGSHALRGIAHVHLPTDAGTQQNCGHCFITFAGLGPLTAFVEAFQGRFLHHSEEGGKPIRVVRVNASLQHTLGGSFADDTPADPQKGISVCRFSGSSDAYLPGCGTSSSGYGCAGVPGGALCEWFASDAKPAPMLGHLLYEL